MSFVIALIFVLMIANNIWMERRISALERRWNEFLDKQTQYAPLSEASRQPRR